MLTGLYRTQDSLLGWCVRVHWASGGDAAPVVHREVYRAMGGKPAYEALPEREEYVRNHRVLPDPLELS